MRLPQPVLSTLLAEIACGGIQVRLQLDHRLLVMRPHRTAGGAETNQRDDYKTEQFCDNIRSVIPTSQIHRAFV
jgi:hypothetical protein